MRGHELGPRSAVVNLATAMLLFVGTAAVEPVADSLRRVAPVTRQSCARDRSSFGNSEGHETAAPGPCGRVRRSARIPASDVQFVWYIPCSRAGATPGLDPLRRDLWNTTGSFGISAIAPAVGPPRDTPGFVRYFSRAPAGTLLQPLTPPDTS